MELILNSKFEVLSADELQCVDGGKPWTTAIALVSLWGTVFYHSFNAGRQFARDTLTN